MYGQPDGLLGTMGMKASARRCGRCGGLLAGDNQESLCRPCQRVARADELSPPEVPPEFWDNEELREALLRERHIGHAVRIYRRHPFHGRRPIPQEVAARWLNIGQTQLARIERGRAISDLDRLIQWAKTLRIPQELLWFNLPADERGDRVEMKRRQFLASAAPSTGPKLVTDLSQITIDDLIGNGAYRKADPTSSARSAGRALTQWNNIQSQADNQVWVLTAKQIGIGELKQLEATVHAFRTWDHQYGGGLRRKAVLGQLNELAELLPQPHPRPLRRRLFSVAAQLAIVAGHMSSDSRQEGTAYLYLDLALDAARESGDANLGARAANAMARQLLSDGYVTESLAVLDQAQKSLKGLNDENEALLLSSKAWAYAHAGSYDAMVRSLGEASELLISHSAPGLFGSAEMAGVSGACFEMLALRADPARARRAKQAEEYILRALNTRDPIYVRSRALDLVGLANVRLSQSELEMAMESGELALEVATKLRSLRATRRVHALAIRALEDFPGVSLVSDFAENVRCRLP